MLQVEETPKQIALPWTELAWFAALVIAAYCPILLRMAEQWSTDPDVGHGFFVPLTVGVILWQKRAELAATERKTCWWGLAVVLWGALQMLVGTLGVDLFTSRTALVLTLFGCVWFLGGTEVLRKTAFALALLFLMIPIPGVVYNQLTFPLQLVASELAAGGLSVLGVPVVREGNILELPNMQLQVVEACSGIRSLLTLTFLSLVYGHFFERRTWLRVVLFLATVPIAIAANAGRVMFTGILSQIKPDLAEGFFHESTGWIVFLIALAILVVFHRVMVLVTAWSEQRRTA